MPATLSLLALWLLWPVALSIYALGRIGRVLRATETATLAATLRE